MAYRSTRAPAGFWSLLFAAILLGAVYAAGVPARHDDSGVRDTVQRQLQAFAVDDAGQAFALADPALRTQFGNADDFLATVRAQYPMVLRPASVLFLKPENHGTTALQKVRVTDSEGGGWLVTYLLHRQNNDQWLISGCTVSPDRPAVIV